MFKLAVVVSKFVNLLAADAVNEFNWLKSVVPGVAVNILPLLSTAKYPTALPVNAIELLYCGNWICFVCILADITTASLLELLPLNNLVWFW